MNTISKNETAVDVFGVPVRAFNVVTASDGRILNQTIKASRQISAHERLVVSLRFDDECNNGHESFAITADLYDSRQKRDRGLVACGCLHDDIAKHFPEFARLIPWHLMSTDGPMHYLANTAYHARQHGPTHAWVYYTGPNDPLGIGETRERLLGYEKAAKARECEGKPGYRVQWDEKTAKVRNLEHARSCAVWPDATDAELCADPETLKAALMARLPALLERFKADMLAVGFDWPAAR